MVILRKIMNFCDIYIFVLFDCCVELFVFVLQVDGVVFVDVIFGMGGYLEVFFECFLNIWLIGFDCDIDVLCIVGEWFVCFCDCIIFVYVVYDEIGLYVQGVVGIFFDFGVLFFQFDEVD